MDHVVLLKVVVLYQLLLLHLVCLVLAQAKAINQSPEVEVLFQLLRPFIQKPLLLLLFLTFLDTAKKKSAVGLVPEIELSQAHLAEVKLAVLVAHVQHLED